MSELVEYHVVAPDQDVQAFAAEEDAMAHARQVARLDQMAGQRIEVHRVEYGPQNSGPGKTTFLRAFRG
jgi:hypothetical protein